MKRNMGIFMALAIFYILVAVLALIILGGKNSFFNKGKKVYLYLDSRKKAKKKNAAFRKYGK